VPHFTFVFALFLHLNPLQESANNVLMAYVLQSDSRQERFEEVDALDCAGSWFQAFIISKTSHHIMVHFSGLGFEI
jgi:hypothetical protein